MSSELMAGVATVETTLPAGSMMACFPRGKERTPRRATGADLPMMARALVLDDGSTAVAIVSVDVAIVREDQVAGLRERLAGRLGERSPYVVLAATHTHSSPETSYLFGGVKESAEVEGWVDQLAEVVATAWAGRQPVSCRFGSVKAPLNHNRRVRQADGAMGMVYEYDAAVTTGPTDDELAVLAFDRADGSPLAIVWNFTGHALTLGPAQDAFSPDYPGYACRALEAAHPGATALFLQGAAGNIHPRHSMRADASALEWMAAAVSAAAEEALAAAKPMGGTLAAASRVVEFANRHDASLRVPVEVGVVRIGEVLMGTMPGEPFVEFQLGFKAGLRPVPAVFVGYANGWPGYLPVLAAYDEGGYGVDLATADPPELSRTSLPPGAGERLLEELLAMAREEVSA